MSRDTRIVQIMPPARPLFAWFVDEGDGHAFARPVDALALDAEGGVFVLNIDEDGNASDPRDCANFLGVREGWDVTYLAPIQARGRFGSDAYDRARGRQR